MPEGLRCLVALLDESQEFQRHQAHEARETASALGIDLSIQFAESNAILQVQQVSRATASPKWRPHVILIETVSGEGIARAARSAARAGIGWVIINRDVAYLAELRREYPGLAIGSVTTDQLAIGRIQGQQMGRLLPRGGKVLYVQGRADTSAAQQRLAGATEGLDKAGIEVHVLEGEWTESSGAECVERWIRLKQHPPDLIACQNDAMAMGAIAVLASAGADLTRIPVVGVDGLPEGGQQLVKTGQLAATVVIPSNTGPALRAIAAARSSSASEKRIELVLAPTSFPEVDRISGASERGT
jgi:ABC-type sugar transport system substrate-binding protein